MWVWQNPLAPIVQIVQYEGHEQDSWKCEDACVNVRPLFIFSGEISLVEDWLSG